jgi:hypothetical protein
VGLTFSCARLLAFYFASAPIPFRPSNGYSYDAVKIFMPAGAKKPIYAPYVEHMPPDPTSAIFWLKNRDPAHYRATRRRFG